MSTKLKAGTATSGAVIDADTAGILELQSGSTPTTGLTINGVQGVSVTNCLAVGNATPSTSGAGITFPATQSASTDANTLDDYEEGTFNPSPTASTGAFTTVTSSGRYIKVGNLVTISMTMAIVSAGTGTGVINYQLPFAASGSFQVGPAIESNAVGLTGIAYVSSTTATIRKYDWAGVVIGNNYQWQSTVTYQI